MTDVLPRRNGYPTPARSQRITDNGRGHSVPVWQPLRQHVTDS
jgi:hypothetical protein